jgi:hypothetical protein
MGEVNPGGGESWADWRGAALTVEIAAISAIMRARDALKPNLFE